MPAPIAYVLSTRSLSVAHIEEAAENRIAIEVVPFIATGKLQDDILTKRLAELAGRPLTAIFTSSNAVTTIGTVPQPRWKIFCTGGATRRAVIEKFGEHAIAGVANSAADLAAIIGRERPGECWFFCGDKRRDDLPDSLEAAGWRVHEVVVYRTTLTPQRIDKSYEAILFFSPSAVESFFSINTIGSQVCLFAIGRTTAEAIHIKCSNPVVICEQPDEQVLIREIIKKFDEHTKE